MSREATSKRMRRSERNEMECHALAALARESAEGHKMTVDKSEDKKRNGGKEMERCTLARCP